MYLGYCEAIMSQTILKLKGLQDKEVESLLKKYNIGLTVEEARKIEEEILKRPMTLTEAIVWSIQGSEHCSYKSSRKYLSQLPTKAPNVILGPSEDAGIVELVTYKGDRWGIVMAHESHNHPSQIVPYEGAATGVGGIVRDVACMGAKVIACADPLRFGDAGLNKVKWIARGVTDGIAGYANPIGVPNIAGDIYFNSSFNENCIVNVVALGLVKESEIIHSYAPKYAGKGNYDIILIGKPTDNSGFGGASFASFELDEEELEKNKGAVQEPNAFLKRHLLVSTYDLFKILKKKKLLDKVGFKDIGGGGILCASVELVDAAGLGAEIDVNKIHVAMKNLEPYVILTAETQERFIWIAHPKVTRLILDHYNKTWDLPKVSKGARASVIGKVTKGNKYIARKTKNQKSYHPVASGKTKSDEYFVNARACDITKGLRYDRPLKKSKIKNQKSKFIEPKDYNKVFLGILAHVNIASCAPIYEKYDKTVQGATIVERGQADAGVIAPLLDEQLPVDLKKTSIALSVSSNPIYSRIDAYWGAVNAVVESMRKVASVGAIPWAITDCLNYGNPEKPEQMWQFSEGVRGVGDVCRNIHLKVHKKSPTPIVSGNVSLYNESSKCAIDPSPIIACLGRLDDYSKAITMEFKETDSRIILIGVRKEEMGGSVFCQLEIKKDPEACGNIPKPEFSEVQNQIYAITDMIDKELLLASSAVADGGVAVALAKMCFGGDGKNKIGCEIDLNKVGDKKLKISQKLFSETGGFIIETKEVEKIKKICDKYNVEMIEIGTTIQNSKCKIQNANKNIINLNLNEMSRIWLNGLREKIK